ncbi:MAG: 4-hydroxy-3-methylbut-2-en-1-yl diphosphate synthase [Proteiniphilum sp.]|jgi:(E)-4-hydroxy-3-methylbut-2-enyl-diphosphate synthase|nr:4-hydroxy-3-methylbut-2-en-1-yl diphosphate synthase [Proteiniphilum sp.]
MSFFNYKRRPTIDVHVGNITMGGNYPVVVQTMTNTNTLDTEASVAQCERIIAAGAGLIRLTAQGVREANNLREIRQQLRDKGYATPLSADIHFNPRAAEAAAAIAEKVRINPGNFVDKQKTFAELAYTDEEYAHELEKIRSKVIPFLRICKEHGTAIRIGVNHGSLSDRIMSRYGDTPEGVVESCMEYLRIAMEERFADIVISIKASNTLLMTKAVRLLVAAMDREDIRFPLHIGVTEAGDGEDGRMKSAVGIGALLSDGLGDTIRVSLSEEPEAEIPVARKLVDYVTRRKGHTPIQGEVYPAFSLYSTERRETDAVWNIGGERLPVVISDRSKVADMSVNPHFIPDYIYVGNHVPANFPKGMKSIADYAHWEEGIDNFPLFTVDSLDKITDCNAEVKFLRISYPELSDEVIAFLKETPKIAVILTTAHQNGVGEQRAFFHALLNAGCRAPVILRRSYTEDEAEDIQVKAGADFGAVLLDGFGNGVMLSNEGKIDIMDMDAYAFGLLQAARIRTSKTEFISCPGCGRTLFDLQATVALVKQHFSHLKHLKIGVMGCIVNGPGEMADADYGYVGAERGKISLYRKKQLVEKNIPQAEAVEHLIRLIKDHGDWIDPEEK